MQERKRSYDEDPVCMPRQDSWTTRNSQYNWAKWGIIRCPPCSKTTGRLLFAFFTKYVQTLLACGKRPNQVVTKISLRKAASESGIDFSQAVFKVVRSLDAAEQKNIDAMADQMKDYASGLTTAAMVEDTPFVDAETGEIIEPLK